MRRSVVAVLTVAVLGTASAVLPVTAAHAAATTWYVGSQNCTDSGPGTSTQPYCTLETAFATAQPGDTVQVIGGYAKPAVITRSGAPGAPITLSGGIQAPLTLAGVHDLALSELQIDPGTGVAAALTVQDSQWVTADYSAFLGRSGVGVVLTGATSGVSLQRSQLQGAGSIHIGAGVAGTVIASDDLDAAGTAIQVSGAVGTAVAGDTIYSGAASVAVDSAATGTSIENLMAQGLISVSADSAANTHEGYNTLFVDGPAYDWAGSTFLSPADFHTQTGQGVADELGGPVTVSNSPGMNPLAIDSADANAPGELATDIGGRSRVDDLLVPNTGTGPGYYDRGDWETQDPYRLQKAAVSPDQIASGSTVTISTQADDPWHVSPVLTYDFGDGTPKESTSATSVQHFYAAVPSDGTGRYQVTVTSPFGWSAQTFAIVNPPGPLEFTGVYPLVPSGATPLHVQAMPEVLESPFTTNPVVIDYGDGSRPTVALTHDYPHAGRYLLRATASDMGGRSVTRRASILVGPETVLLPQPALALDSFHRIGPAHGLVPPGRVVRLKTAGAAVLASPSSVLLSIRASGAGSAGRLVAYSDGVGVPSVPTLVYGRGGTADTLAWVPVGANGTVDLLMTSGGPAYLSAAIVGYRTVAASGLTQAAPEYPMSAQVVAGGGATPAFQVSPRNSAGAMFQVSVVSAPTAAAVTLYPCAGRVPAYPSFYVAAGQPRTVTVVAPLDAQGRVCVHSTGRSTRLMLDTSAVYQVPGDVPPNRPEFSVAPVRVLDTVAGVGVRGAFNGVWVRHTVRLAGVGAVPWNATGVYLSVSSLTASRDGYMLTLWSGAGHLDGPASLLNVSVGQLQSNLVYVPLYGNDYGVFELRATDNLQAIPSANFAGAVVGYTLD